MPSPASSPAASRRSRLEWGLSFAFWAFFGFFCGSQLYLSTRAEKMAHSFWRMVGWQVLAWLFWAVLTPWVLRLGRRFPFERATWPRALGLHVAVCLAIAAVHTAYFVLLTTWLVPFGGMTVPRPFRAMLLGRFLSQLQLELVLYAAILLVGYALDYYARFREREYRASQLEAQLAQAQLRALEMQLHPHFLFNTLNGIAGLVRDHENKAAVEMIAGLSELLRHTLENAGRQEVPLREELGFLELYLGLQQTRFSDRLRVRMEVPPEVLDALVPNLVLQPLVENAIRHGIAPRVAPGTVGVSAACEGGLLRLTVFDDGPGLRQGWRLEESRGIGLANTRARLEQLYGERHRFGVQNREGGGVEATVAIPLRWAARGEAGGG